MPILDKEKQELEKALAIEMMKQVNITVPKIKFFLSELKNSIYKAKSLTVPLIMLSLTLDLRNLVIVFLAFISVILILLILI